MKNTDGENWYLARSGPTPVAMLALMSVLGPALHKKLKDAGIFQPVETNFPLNVDMYGIKVETPWMTPINNPYRGASSMSSFYSLTRSTGGPSNMARCAFDPPSSTSALNQMPAPQGQTRDPETMTSSSLALNQMPAPQGPTKDLETVSSSSLALNQMSAAKGPSKDPQTVSSSASSSAGQKQLPSPKSSTRGAASCQAMQESTASSINGTSFNERVSFAEEVTCEILSSDEEEFYPSIPGRIGRETNGRPMNPEIEARSMYPVVNVDMHGIKIETPWMSAINNPSRGASSMSPFNSLTRSTEGPSNMAKCAFDPPSSTSALNQMPAPKGKTRDPETVSSSSLAQNQMLAPHGPTKDPKTVSSSSLALNQMPAPQGSTKDPETVSSSSLALNQIPAPQGPTKDLETVSSSSLALNQMQAPQGPTKDPETVSSSVSSAGQKPLTSPKSPTRGAVSCPAMQQGSSTASSINGTSLNKRVSFAEEVTCEFLSSDEEESYPSTPGRFHKRYDNVRRRETNGRPMSPEIEAIPIKTSVDKYLFLPELEMLQEEEKMTTAEVLHEPPKVNIDPPNFASEEQNKPSALETTTCSSKSALPVASEDVPVATDDVPASTEDVPASTDDVPASTEDVPASTEDVPVATEDVPVATEDVPAFTDDVPASSEDVPASTDDVPASTEDVPASTDDVPASTEDIPASTEDVPVATEDVPVDSEEVVSVSGEEQLSGHACAGARCKPTKLDLAKAVNIKVSTSLRSYKEPVEDKQPTRKVISLPELVYHPMFRPPGRTPEIEVERVPKSEDYVDECFLFEGCWRESEIKPDYYQPYKRPTTLEEYYSHNREFRESITFGAERSRMSRMENKNISGQNSSNNGLMVSVMAPSNEGAEASETIHAENQRAHPPFDDFSECFPSQWEPKEGARPKTLNTTKWPQTVDEYFSMAKNREYAESLAFCHPIQTRNQDFSTQAYSFSNPYHSNFSEEDKARYHAWENYQMDYVGKDSSDNVIAKIDQTLTENAHHPHTYLPHNHQESWWNSGPKK